MSNREQEYLEMFRGEAHENQEELNRLLTELENDLQNQQIIDSVFRITHTLKGNAMGLGLKPIAELSHVMEDIFGAIKNGSFALEADLFNNLFKANDKLGDLIIALKSGEKVSYKGISTKLKVALRKALESNSKQDTAPSESTETKNNTDTEKEEVSKETLPPVNLEVEEPENSQFNTRISFSDYVNVSVEKLDALLDIVGELIIEKDSLIAQSTNLESNTLSFSRLHRITSDLQYGIMGVRLVPVGFMFNKFQRIIRDVATLESKEVELQLDGTEIEIDRNILKILSDSLVHLVRNAVSHGIESSDERIKAGKPEKGCVRLSATNEKETVIITVSDDGKGMNHNAIGRKAVQKGLTTEEELDRLSEYDKLNMIFHPGFSNAETITEVSGRGVGMDVVKRAVESIGGRIQLETEVGKGSSIQLLLPSSLSLKGALLLEVSNNKYAVPLSFTESVVAILKNELRSMNNGMIYNYMGKSIYLKHLADVFYPKEAISIQERLDKINDDEKLNVLIVSYENALVGFVVDRLLQQKEIVEKTLAPPLDEITLFSGASILGDGNVCLVLNVPGIIKESLMDKTLKNGN